MKTKYEPIGHTVLIEAVNVSTTLQLPESVRPDQYTVVARGNGKLVPKGLKPGDLVILNPGSSLVSIKNTNYSITNADNILAKVNG